MDNFIRDGIYMEGDILAGDVRCEQRPSSDYQFINGEWRFDFQEVTTQVLDLARTLRAPIFSILDGRQVSALVLGDIGLAEAIEDLKVGLRNITSVNLSAVKDREIGRAHV